MQWRIIIEHKNCNFIEFNLIMKQAIEKTDINEMIGKTKA